MGMSFVILEILEQIHEHVATRKFLKESLFAKLFTKILTVNVGVIQIRENAEFCEKCRTVHQLPRFSSDLLLLSAVCSS